MTPGTPTGRDGAMPSRRIEADRERADPGSDPTAADAHEPARYRVGVHSDPVPPGDAGRAGRSSAPPDQADRVRAQVKFAPAPRISAVLFGRDGTLVQDVRPGSSPDAVLPMPTAREALDEVRLHGLRTGVVSDRNGIDGELVRAVNARIDRLLGPFGAFRWCPHPPDGDCLCRTPAPGLVLAACADLGVDPSETAVIGDRGTDVAAAAAAGAFGVLVLSRATKPSEVDSAGTVASTLLEAVRLVTRRW